MAIDGFRERQAQKIFSYRLMIIVTLKKFHRYILSFACLSLTKLDVGSKVDEEKNNTGLRIETLASLPEILVKRFNINLARRIRKLNSFIAVT